jgi:hypothetical protein
VVPHVSTKFTAFGFKGQAVHEEVSAIVLCQAQIPEKSELYQQNYP